MQFVSDQAVKLIKLKRDILCWLLYWSVVFYIDPFLLLVNSPAMLGPIVVKVNNEADR